MTLNRDTSRRPGAEGVFRTDSGSDGGSAARRFGRLVGGSKVSRRIALHRVLGGVAAFLVVAALATMGLAHAYTWAQAWLHRQSEYQIPFAAIELVPDPPRWIKSGRRGLLEEVRRRARLPESLPILECDLQRLAEDFQRESPWVRRVRRVLRPDRGHLRIELDYRRPIAQVRLETGGTVTVDADGVVLPPEDLDLRGLPSLVILTGVIPKGATVVPLSGKSLRIETGEPDPPPGPDSESPGPARTFRAAARLAGFLTDAVATPAASRFRIPLTAIQANPSGLWVESNGSLLRWGPLPGSEPPGERTDAEKWNMLLAWLADHDLASIRYPFPGYLEFDGDRAAVRQK